MYTNKFIRDLNDFQQKSIDELLKNKNKLIFFKSQMFTGKSSIAKRLFEHCEDEVVFYHTGCSPTYFDDSFNRFKKLIEKYKKNSMTFILDEYYNEELLNILSKYQNTTCYVFTNDLNLKHDNFIDFNYYESYKKMISQHFNEYYNLHQIFNKDKQFSEKNKHLRRKSSKTVTIIKINNEKIIDEMEY